MKSKLMPKKAKGAARQVPDATVMPFGMEIIGTLCLPDELAWSNPIMPEGFITYTDLMPSLDFEG
jgi:hypothetical protein